MPRTVGSKNKPKPPTTREETTLSTWVEDRRNIAMIQDHLRRAFRRSRCTQNDAILAAVAEFAASIDDGTDMMSRLSRAAAARSSSPETTTKRDRPAKRTSTT